ncbi:MAG TPA: hypothetical protein VMV69_04010 [Pirellulales bacterium]|nr:hypothetical protein [Pirellulales bacterium]
MEYSYNKLKFDNYPRTASKNPTNSNTILTEFRPLAAFGKKFQSRKPFVANSKYPVCLSLQFRLRFPVGGTLWQSNRRRRMSAVGESAWSPAASRAVGIGAKHGRPSRGALVETRVMYAAILSKHS